MNDHSESCAARSRLALIDCSRGIAASIVVIAHAVGTVRRAKYFGADPLHGLSDFGGRGVDYFFVLSGFIIAYVHWFDFGRAERMKTYVVKRFIRVYPLLWVVSIPSLIASVLMKSEYMPTNWIDRVNVTVGSLLLVPTTVLPIPVVIWTLRHEILFYLIFSLMLFRPRWGAVSFILWGCLCIFHATFGFASNVLSDFLLSLYNLEFLLGICCGYIIRNFNVRFPMTLCAIGVACFLCAGMFFVEPVRNVNKPWETNSTSGLQVMQFGLSSALIVLGLAQLDRDTKIQLPSFLTLLGSASYSIYLIHFPVVSIGCKVLKSLSYRVTISPLTAVLCTATAGILAGVLLHKFVEVPLLRVVRNAALPSRTATAPI